MSLKLLRSLGLASVSLTAYWSFIFVATHLPAQFALRPAGQINDKLAHFVAYAGLATLLAWVVSRHRGLLARVGHAKLVGVLVLYASVDELLQLTVPGRHADWWDWAADLFGAATGLAFFAVATRIWNDALLANWWRVLKSQRQEPSV